MYSPKISENLIPDLYKIAKRENKHMTEVVNEVLKAAIDDKKENKHERKE